jgi:hypothetical protein
MKREIAFVALVCAFLFLLRYCWRSGFVSGFIVGHCEGELTERASNAIVATRAAIEKAKGD